MAKNDRNKSNKGLQKTFFYFGLEKFENGKKRVFEAKNHNNVKNQYFTIYQIPENATIEENPSKTTTVVKYRNSGKNHNCCKNHNNGKNHNFCKITIMAKTTIFAKSH